MIKKIFQNSVILSLIILSVGFWGCKEKEIEHYKGLMQDQNNPVVSIDTNKGNIVVELFKAKAPLSAANFLQYTVMAIIRVPFFIVLLTVL